MKTKIQYLRNATMKVNYGGVTFLTDPLFADKGAYTGYLYRNQLINPTSELTLSPTEIMNGVDVVLVSHTHIPGEDVPSGPSDHFDALALETIRKDMPIIVQSPDARSLQRHGFTDVTPIETNLEFEGIKITRFEGNHTDKPQIQAMVGQVSGFVLQADGYPTLLWTGDTILTENLKQAIKSFSPEIIITHSGGASMPIDANGTIAKLVMDADDTLELIQLAPQAKFVAIHMEALDHCPVTRKELREKGNNANISENQLFIPANGESVEF